MSSPRRSLLGGRFARRIALTVAVAGLGAAALTALLVNAAFGSRFDTYLSAQQTSREQQVVTVLADSFTRAGGWAPSALDQVAPGLVMSGSAVTVLDAAGHRVWSLTDTQPNPAMDQMRRTMMGTPTLGPPDRLPITVNDQPVGTALIQVPRAAVPALDQQFRSSVNRLLVVGGAVAGILALLTGLVISRRATRGIEELTAAANDLRAGRKDRRATVGGDDEIGQLARSFNTLADTVTREDELRRVFAADVAHELRTPLTVLRGQLEAVQDHITPPSPTVIASMHEETLRLGRLVADLETMADTDAAGFTLHHAPVALQPLIGAVLDSVAARCAEQDLRLVRRLDDVTVTGDELRLRQIITNLVSNALKFTPTGGTITLRLHRAGPWAELTVTDTGLGIPPEEIPRVFDRFFRGAASGTGGSGIGLAVVAELVAAHGGTVSVDSAPGHGSTFLLRLPAATDGSADTDGTDGGHARFMESS